MGKKNIGMIPAFILVRYKTVAGYRIIIKVLKCYICTYRSLSAFHLCVLLKGEEDLAYFVFQSHPLCCVTFVFLMCQICTFSLPIPKVHTGRGHTN